MTKRKTTDVEETPAERLERGARLGNAAYEPPAGTRLDPTTGELVATDD